MAQQRLLAFIEALRGAGLRISPVEAEDAMRSVTLVGYAPRQRFREALRVTLVKKASDRPAFDQTFARFFQFEQAPASVADEPAVDTQMLSPEARALLEQTPEQLTAQLAQAAAQINLPAMEVITQQGIFTQRLLMQMGMGAIDDAVITLQGQGARGQARAQQLRQWRQAVREQAAALVRRQFELHGAPKGRELREKTLRATPFRQLDEFAEVQQLVRKMARRLASLHQRRQRRARRGALDARRTLVASVRQDAVPVTLYWRQQERRKSRVWVICDVSRSVSSAARFLLQFLYAMADVLPRVRSFAFAAHFDEVTQEFQRYSPEQAVTRVLERLSGGGTDYGAMLESFWLRHERELDRHSTVIILGDARNNGLPERAEHLDQIRRRAKQVLWLNPEAPSRWNSGDAVMASYQPYCRRVAQCSSLDDLERFVDQLLKRL